MAQTSGAAFPKGSAKLLFVLYVKFSYDPDL